jgi:hypothetical protein
MFGVSGSYFDGDLYKDKKRGKEAQNRSIREALQLAY